MVKKGSDDKLYHDQQIMLQQARRSQIVEAIPWPSSEHTSGWSGHLTPDWSQWCVGIVRWIWRINGIKNKKAIMQLIKMRNMFECIKWIKRISIISCIRITIILDVKKMYVLR